MDLVVKIRIIIYSKIYIIFFNIIMFNYYFILIDYNGRLILKITVWFFFWCGYVAERKSWERVTAGSFGCSQGVCSPYVAN